MITLIANPDPTRRILLHTAPSARAYITVETLDHDAIGAPQWRITDDGASEVVPRSAVLAMIAHAAPAAMTGPGAHSLGTYKDGAGDRWRCTIVHEHAYDALWTRLITEQLRQDQMGAPRWNRTNQCSLQCDGKIERGTYDDNHLIECLFPRTFPAPPAI